MMSGIRRWNSRGRPLDTTIHVLRTWLLEFERRVLPRYIFGARLRIPSTTYYVGT